jgi:predicted outer membrane protein
MIITKKILDRQATTTTHTMTTIANKEDVKALGINLAEERAAREQVEQKNHELVNDLFILSADFDDLVRHSQKQDQEIEAAKQALEASTKECKSLKKLIKHTHKSVKTNVLANHKLVKDLQVQLQWKDTVCKSMKQRLKHGGGDQSGDETASGEVSVSVSPSDSESSYDSSTYTASLEKKVSSGGGALSAYLKKAKSCSPSLDLHQQTTAPQHLRAGARSIRCLDHKRNKPNASGTLLSKIEECKEMHIVIGSSFFQHEEDEEPSFDEFHVLGNGTARKATCNCVSDDERSLPDKNKAKAKAKSAIKNPSLLNSHRRIPLPLESQEPEEIGAAASQKISSLKYCIGVKGAPLLGDEITTFLVASKKIAAAA